MKVLSCKLKLLEERQVKEEIKLLLSKLPNLLPEPFLEVVKSSRKIVTQALQLSPKDTSRLMHSVGVSYSMKRQMVTVLGKLNSFSPFAGEKRQREYEKEAKYLLDKSKVEKGAMLLWKTALANTTSPCEDDENSEVTKMLAGRELEGSQEELAADKAALVLLLSRRVSLQQPITLVQCGDTAGLESLAQEEARMLGRQPEVVCDEWEVWQQVGGWKCDCCLLTKFDHEILWSECELCETRVHTFCQVRHSALHRCKALSLSL